VTPVHPPSGRTIILELVKEMEERLYPLLYRILPPSVYHVYLHPDDYRDVEPIVAVLTADAQRGLAERIEQLNQRPRWQQLLHGKQPPIEVPPAGWEIAIHPDANGELQRGQIGIVSSLSLPHAPTFEGGTPTTRIARTVVTGTLRRTTTREEPVPVPGPVSAPAHVPVPESATAPAMSISTATPALARAPAPAQAQASAPAPAATAPRDARSEANRGVARFAYVDEQGAHIFVMRKDLVSIGRGGSAHWVDVQVATGPRVSREHCRIRRAADGRFFLQDLSTWGTSVDGKKVEPYVRTSASGQLEETGREHELPPDARIHLADTLLIEFQTLQSS
jgi:hypothetical protein